MIREDLVTATAARALHDLLDRPGEAPQDGDPLPILWHWLAFLPQARQAELGDDGHPRTGDFLPETKGLRRMYAGGEVRVTGAPRVGERMTRTSEVVDVTRKRGRSGELLFVTVEHRIDAGIVERSDIVYREPAPAKAATAGEAVIDPTLLFRFSALTYNAHRIHYDRDYATAVEGYPGLVVHGPLQAILLANTVTRPVTRFAFRSIAPAFDIHALRVDADELAVYSGHTKTMTATFA
jgi:3-methylfumaryl-CoA hydratase